MSMWTVITLYDDQTWSTEFVPTWEQARDRMILHRMLGDTVRVFPPGSLELADIQKLSWLRLR